MTAQLFKEYVRQLDRCFAAKKSSILIVLYNALAHADVGNLSAFKLLFLPSNTTVLAQALDQGIIRSVKQIYRRKSIAQDVDRHGERQNGHDRPPVCYTPACALTDADFSDSDIVAAIAPRPDSSQSEEESDVEVHDGPLIVRSCACYNCDASFAKKRSLTGFEDTVVVARPPRRQVKITDLFAACP
ncbi:hypothetical protein HPB51_026895 [Rhipicephalus microplus]|uniref:DDE-1 domain-containing protein n=1 Tax=Rhipicephalus microplus TaxID=6941 RepID=A0A9J6D1Q7_RHIMP|nr:hypothetical protein HPB51_026895 [Rhipicephalus microplus]